MQLTNTDLVRVTLDEAGAETWEEQDPVFDVTPRAARQPSRWMRLVLVVVAVGLLAVMVRHVKSVNSVRSSDPLRGPRAQIAAAHETFSARQAIIEAIGSQMERRQQELRDVEWASSGVQLPSEVEPAQAASKTKMAEAKRTRASELLQALEIRRSALTDQNIRLLSRIRRAEVELIRGERLLDEQSPVDGVEKRIESLLAGKDGV